LKVYTYGTVPEVLAILLFQNSQLTNNVLELPLDVQFGCWKKKSNAQCFQDKEARKLP
jgi:hypothetical protein